MRRILAAIPALIASLLLVTVALAQSASDYDYSFTVTVTNNTGAALTDKAVRAAVNATNLTGEGYLAADGQDILVIDISAGTENPPTAQIDGNPSSWWYSVGSLAGGASVTFQTYVSQNNGSADNPQHIYLSGGAEELGITDDATLDITTNLTVDMTGVNIDTLASSTVYLLQKLGAYELGLRDTADAGSVVDEVFFTVFENAFDATDLTSNNNDGTVTPTVDLTTGTLGDWAADFDGTAGRIEVGSDSSIDDIWDGGGSVELWLNIENDTDAIADVLSKGGQRWEINLIDSDGASAACASNLQAIRLFVKFSGGSGRWWSTSCILDTTAGWQHIAITYDSDAVGNDAIIYLGGVSQGVTETVTPTGTRDTDAADTLSIGDDPGGGSNQYEGQMDDARVWNDIRTSGEVSDNYLAELTGSEAGLVAYWQFNIVAYTAAASTDLDADTAGNQALAVDTPYNIVGTYDGANVVLDIDGGTDEASTASTVTLNTTTSNVIIGNGDFRGTLARTRIGDTSVASPTYRLDLQYEPDQMAQTQEGNGGNSWTWQGTITDQSASTQTVTYGLVRDMTNISVAVGAITAISPAEGSASAEADPSAVSGSLTNPLTFTEGSTPSDFGFPLNIIATLNNGTVTPFPLHLLAGVIVLLGSLIAGFVALRSTKVPAFALFAAMMVGSSLIDTTPIADALIFLVVIMTLGMVVLLPRPFERAS